MNKNLVIFALAVLVVMGSVWGSVSNKKKMLVSEELAMKSKELETVRNQNDQAREEVLAKTAALQEDMQKKDARLQQIEGELGSLQKKNNELEGTNKRMTAKLEVCTAAVDRMSQDRRELDAQLKEQQAKPAAAAATSAGENDLAACEARLKGELKNNLKLKAWLEVMRKRAARVSENSDDAAGKSDNSAAAVALRQQLSQERDTTEDLKQQLAMVQSSSKKEMLKQSGELESLRAQVIGLQKMIEEKNLSLDTNKNEMDRLKVNMDILLNKIAEQRNALQQQESDNKDLARELAAKKLEVADLQEKLQQTPVR